MYKDYQDWTRGRKFDPPPPPPRPMVVTCRACGGRGSYTYTVPDTQICPACNGTGRVPGLRPQDVGSACKACGGQGRFLVQRTEIMPCSACNGKGSIIV